MTSTVSTKNDTTVPAKRPAPHGKKSSDEVSAMLLPSLYRLTEGLPRKELKMMISEAMICEEALENEIRKLQEAVDSPPGSEASKKPSVQAMIDSEVTPPDRFSTISSLLGRLRDDLATPLPPNSTLPALRAQVGLGPPPPKKKKKESNTQPSAADPAASKASSSPGAASSLSLENQKKVLSLYQLPEYTKEHANPTALMAIWKKISTHRSSLVFRRPVNPKEAPGYTERIAFPMDLSLVRKMILARQIKSYADLHQRLGLICHNCVKYNGRESDYGIVTREFESNVDEMMVAAVFTATQEARNPRLKSATPPPAGTATPAPVSQPKKPSVSAPTAAASTKAVDDAAVKAVVADKVATPQSNVPSGESNKITEKAAAPETAKAPAQSTATTSSTTTATNTSVSKNEAGNN